MGVWSCGVITPSTDSASMMLSRRTATCRGPVWREVAAGVAPTLPADAAATLSTGVATGWVTLPAAGSAREGVNTGKLNWRHAEVKLTATRLMPARITHFIEPFAIV